MLNPTLNIPQSSSNNTPLKFDSIDKHGIFANPQFSKFFDKFEKDGIIIHIPTHDG